MLLLTSLLFHLNFSTTVTLGSEEIGRCREVVTKSQWMDFLPAGKEKSGRSTVFSFAEHNQILEVYQWSDLSSLV